VALPCRPAWRRNRADWQIRGRWVEAITPARQWIERAAVLVLDAVQISGPRYLYRYLAFRPCLRCRPRAAPSTLAFLA
jgi:hypothetical protein